MSRPVFVQASSCKTGLVNGSAVGSEIGSVTGPVSGSKAKAALVTKSDKVIPGYPLVQAVLEVAIPRGANKHKILRGTGIFDETFSTPQHTGSDQVSVGGGGLLANTSAKLSAKQCIALLSNVSSQCKGNDVSFLIGKSLGGVWLTENLEKIKHCRNLEHAMSVLMNIRWECFPLVSFKRFDVKDNVLWVLQDTMGCQKNWPFIAQLYLSMLVALIKYWTDTRLPISFGMDFDRPRNVEDFETYLGLRTTFNAPLLSIMLPKSCMATPFPNANCEHAQPVVDSPAKYTAREVKQARYSASCFSLLDFVRSQTLREPQRGLADLAESLCCSTATLKRKLSDHHYSYRALSEEARRQQAIVLLALKKLNNEQSASEMAFSDLTNFRRAVKRLTGLTPSELRAR
ncbi:helix-turn-helix domain-containing protein [Alteromonas sp. 1_MG-2023]|uniref:helix-turn-helix domain-containing protein n=1 Tax=Alteromonas sp. 1_MG-2023 TaxID=3062669 RepID=UPI0026E3D765|nr:helix-turn-helix domain-containing protein [Alteromonas sp. 1_MG-2023]MDO6567554.1 helix-turn-helix domain-containing protein [Alteromonas sp. 1_MG-2023]